MEDFKYQLILEVEARACLFDKNLKDYHNRDKVYAAWMEISAIVDKPVEECKKKWKDLKDTFMKHHKCAINAPSGSGPKPSITWRYYKQMLFYRIFAEIPRTVSSLPQPKIRSENRNIDAEDNIIIMDDEVDEEPPRKLIKKDESTQQLISAIERINAEEKPSALQSFFNSVCAQAEHFSNFQKLQLQKKCIFALEEVEMMTEI